LIGILGPIARAFVLAVLDTAQEFLLCCPIARQLIRDDDAREILTSFEGIPPATKCLEYSLVAGPFIF
jgi:hypothetical protein